MEAFKQFDFDANEQWKGYLRSVELTNDSPGMLTKLKARWYKKNVDSTFELPAAGAGAASASSKFSSGPAPAASASSTPKPPTSGTTGSGSGTYASSNYAAPPPPRYGGTGGGGGTYGGPTAQRRLFMMHLALLVLGVWSVVPLLPGGRRAYVFLLRCSIMAQGYKIYLQHGLPSFRPWSMAMAWVQRVIPTADFLQLLVAFSFSAAPPMVLVAAPILVLAAYHAAAYVAAHHSGHPLWQRYGARLHAVMLRRQSDAVLLNAACEVATAFMLVMHLLTPARSFLTLIFYVQVLKLKLHVPDTAVQHRKVWSMIDDYTRPYRARLPPMVETAIQAGARWMTAVPGAPQ
ncbi:hypothetical protein CHLRE_02g099650v5 [Chlamydomonas reinhardtii]|uniref:Uncharacterized protein n=1 Tax=Chlamydomonas reinhardtii TaxID=3055 RepID=A0A2K3E261_CHLRE|nr:uncharacterized protein CHLRE_02g099650v5 [Chlamydomonas reinhardtii]PNW86880.1 hypothetical protein CHLRE_02g099650v5 [Chlamydomonas reinhardtii]